MRLPFPLLSLVAAVLYSLAEASSRIRNPIGALSTVQNATIHTHNHRLTALSNFDLTFNIRDDLYVKFKLEPNHDILASDATVSYLAPDGSVERKESVNRLGHKVFKGTAWIVRPRSGQHEWKKVGWARILVKRDGRDPFFEGAFAVNHDHHHIQSSSNYARTRHLLDPEVEKLDNGEEYMLLWRDSDIRPTDAQRKHQELRRDMVEDAPSCQADGLNFNANPDHPVFSGMKEPPKKTYGAMDFSGLFGKRQIDSTSIGSSAGVNLQSSIGSTAGCPTTNKVALVGVATDCTYSSDFGSDQEMRENIISQINTASALWEDTFKISLGLADFAIQPAACPATPSEATMWNQPCSDDLDIQQRLNYFSTWRGTQEDGYSHWTLLSTCNTGSAVGLAWLGQACVSGAQTANNSWTGNGEAGGGSETVSGANVVVRTAGANEWQIIAHETGHTYGAVHDCTDVACADSDYVNSQQCCPLSQSTCDAGEQYIMNPSTAQGINYFSPCSIGNICSAIGRKSVNTDCLSDNRNVEVATEPQCGNGIVEPGEDCDCGGTEGCGDDLCCDPDLCTFRDGAVCDDNNEDCCQDCQFLSQGSVCRPSSGECDPQEVCPGDSGNCPKDVTAENGKSCGDGLQCASGQCTSRDDQCKTVMGSYTQGNDTHACDSSGCMISCASPEFGYGVCYGLQQNFLDGTECGGGGTCQNGQCKGSSFGGEALSWIEDHKEIVIGVSCAVGALILFAVLGCIRSCFKRRKLRKRARAPPPPPPGGWQGWQSGAGTRVPPPPMSHAPNQGWYNPAVSGTNRGGWDTPPPPPPAYQGRPVYG
ncbi:hypothetical protein LTR37_016707 [Vermiconidia calcicola]|uniref:Uncharacterized protein n=1 Tax=Vermiconidia calcicola TaxID=1690605 RepID=A0ACC3MM27_9PEZI|nr:hypothetical protein LTR37_016707 [Vermiconidia calcicola]